MFKALRVKSPFKISFYQQGFRIFRSLFCVPKKILVSGVSFQTKLNSQLLFERIPNNGNDQLAL